MEAYLPEGDLCMIEEEDVVSQSPGFPMSAPQLRPNQAGDQCLPTRLHSRVPDSSLGPAC